MNFEVKISYEKVCEGGVQKKVSEIYLVDADDIQSAKDNLIECMRGTMADYEIESVSETKILDFFEYKA